MAVFGLTYNMMDQTGIEYPILSTNWASVSSASYFNSSTDRYFNFSAFGYPNSPTLDMFILDLYDPDVADSKDTTP